MSRKWMAALARGMLPAALAGAFGILAGAAGAQTPTKPPTAKEVEARRESERPVGEQPLFGAEAFQTLGFFIWDSLPKRRCV